MKALLQTKLAAAGLLAEGSIQDSVEAFGAPRRLTAYVRNLRLKQDDVTREVTGPPKSIAYSDVGAPTRAAISFAEKQGISVEELEIVETSKGPYLIARKVVMGKFATEVLTEPIQFVVSQFVFDCSWTVLYRTMQTGLVAVPLQSKTPLVPSQIPY